MFDWLIYWTITGAVAFVALMIGGYVINQTEFSEREERFMWVFLILAGPVGWMLAWLSGEE